jgi:endoglucanase Acf2
MKQKARARHETFNGRFKMWAIMSQTFRAKLERHEKYFIAVANLTQWLIMTSGHDDDTRKLFQVEYNDQGGATSAINNILMANNDSEMEDSDNDEE